MIEDLIIFKDKLGDITGEEMNELINYISTKHKNKVDKYCLTWDELWKIMVFDWPIWENENRNFQKVDDWISQEDMYQEQLYEELDEGNFEREQIKEKGNFTLKLKLDKHQEKIYDVFRSYCENIPQSESDSDKEPDTQSVKDQKSGINTKNEINKEDKSDNISKTEKEDQTEKDEQTEKNDDQSETKTMNRTDKSTTEKLNNTEMRDSTITLKKNVDESMTMQIPVVKVNKLGKIIKDLGYLIDLSFITYDDYVNQTFERKKTHKSIVKRLQKYLWKRIHISE